MRAERGGGEMTASKQARRAARVVPASGRARWAKPGATLRHTKHPDAWAWQVVSLSEVAGLGPYQIFKALRRDDKLVSWRWVRRCLRTFWEFGHPQHKKFRETIVSVSVKERKWIKALLLDQPDMYLDEVVDAFSLHFKRTITMATVSSAIHVPQWTDMPYAHGVVGVDFSVRHHVRSVQAGSELRCTRGWRSR